MFGWLKRRRREKVAARPFPPTWRPILRKRVPFYETLSDARRARFEGLLQAFVDEKEFFGANDFEITEEVKVVIGAAAVRLVLGLDLSFYDRMAEIVVYPGAFRRPGEEDVLLGEAHNFGTVVLSWESVVRGLADPRDGHDTASHEFAHILDRDGGRFDGTPDLHGRDDYRPWATVMSRHYEALRAGKRKERKVLRDYGATNEAEFFAVATESFFEKPRQMKKQTPELYEELCRFYRDDPAARG